MNRQELEQTQRQLIDLRRQIQAKRQKRGELIKQVAADPELAGDVAQLDGEIAVLKEVEPGLVARQQELTGRLAARQRLELKRVGQQ